MLNMKKTLRIHKGNGSKRLLSVMMTLLILSAYVPCLSGAGFAESSLIDITEYASSIDDIGVGDEFELTMTFSNLTGTAYYVQASISSSNFSPTESGATIDIGEMPDANLVTDKIDLKRTGDKNSLVVNFTGYTYTGTGEKRVIDKDSKTDLGSETIYISEAEVDDDDDDDDVDDRDPKLKVDLSYEMQSITAGEEVKLKIPVVAPERNAKNVKIKLTDAIDELPFSFSDDRPWVELNKVNKNGEIATINVRVSPKAKSKVYALNLSMEYENTSEVSFTRTDVIYVKIVNSEVEPIVGVSAVKFSPDRLTAGVENQAVVLTLENSGTRDASAIRVKLSGFSADGIHLGKGIDEKAVESLAAGETQMVYFYLSPATTAKTGEYALEAKLEYTDDAGAGYERTSSIYVPVDGVDTKAIDMEVQNIVSPDKISAGDTFGITFDLVNLSEIKAKYVEVELEYPEGFIPTKSPKKYLKDLEKDAVQNLEFEFMTKEDIETSHYDIYAKVTYQADGDTDEETIKEYMGVGVEGRSGMGRPKILVDDYNFGAETVMAGEEFDLHLQFFNTSSDDITKNIKVSVSADDGVFSPVDSSSSFFIKQIGRQEHVDYVLKLETKRDAEVKTYNLNLVMEYEDGEGNAYDAQKEPYKEEEKLGIPVAQPVRLETGEITTPFEAYVGTPADLEVEFYNMGRSSMYNMFVKLEGDFRSQDGSYFVGNFESGKSDYFTASVIPENEGDIEGLVVFTFEDALGNSTRVEKPFSFYAEPEQSMDYDENDFDMDDEFGDETDQVDGKNKLYMYIAAGVAVLAVAGILIRRRIKKKRALLLELEDDDE